MAGWRSASAASREGIFAAGMDGSPVVIVGEGSEQRFQAQAIAPGRSPDAAGRGCLDTQANLFERGLVDLGIDVLPMKSLLAQMLPSAWSYESTLWYLRNGSNTPVVPSVIIGIIP